MPVRFFRLGEIFEFSDRLIHLKTYHLRHCRTNQDRPLPAADGRHGERSRIHYADQSDFGFFEQKETKVAKVSFLQNLPSLTLLCSVELLRFSSF